MKWTDEAIENWLLVYTEVWNGGTYKPDDTEKLLYAAMLELKRVRAWVLYGCDDSDTVNGVLNGDPAPSEEAK